MNWSTGLGVGRPSGSAPPGLPRAATAYLRQSWDVRSGRIHPRLTTRSAWIDYEGELPIIEGTLIRLQVDHLPGGGDPLPVWLWSSTTGMTSEDADLR
jgi:hypothetical protein